MKLLIAGGGTGGHLMPALALAGVAKELGSAVVLVGAQRGIEARILPHHPFPFHLLPIEPIYRRQWWRNVLLPLVWWRATRAANRVLRDEHPDIVIGTGGYAAGPVVLRAQHLGIPTVLQEQNAFPGLTTRWLVRRARQVHLGFPEARERLTLGPSTQAFAFGNPITPPPTHVDAQAARRELGLMAGAGAGGGTRERTVFVFGGSQGARPVNEALAGALQRGLLGDVNVIWGTGTAHESRYAPLAEPGRVVIRGFFDPIRTAYAAADLVVARAGAMTVSELCAWGKPSVLVPLPSAAADHQTSNARALADAGASLFLAERDLSPETLAETVGALVTDRRRLEELGGAARKRGNPNAARTIVGKILELSQV